MKGQYRCCYALGLMVIGGLLSPQAKAKICATHEPCQVNQPCHCTVAADAYHARYYYFDIAAFQRSHHYQCRLQGGPSFLSWDQGGSQFPLGSQVSCQGACPRFPLTLLIDTDHMHKAVDAAKLRYGVPPSDTPDQVSADCQAD